ncbi:hypothetical protein [Paenibacillus eucommiae]|uniref:Ligand-binding sensor domain-containing protein n=1 Tax=Paenibacillus eucommiae TaxID=1355755 RepID=A0ABS4IXZ3_9BACL|nr:hypothetical protein [Paenibacillus eucommiae]MBP1992449.1 ligand-binding sensor domain-containing protein [Paenibacillus eucommiae]
MLNNPKNEPTRYLFHFSSIKICEDASLVAAPLGRGILRKQKESHEWENLSRGLPNNTHVNRLQVCGNQLYACTNNGLFKYGTNEWLETELAITCYQYKELEGNCFATTQYGLWCRTLGEWKKTAYSNTIVYDFLYLPHFVILALAQGLAIYDRYMDSWMEFPMESAITSLAVYQGHILGITDKGDLLKGDKKGGFEIIHFEDHFLFSIIAKGNEVYVCSERGLYRLSYFRGDITLVSIKLGYPITDIDSDGDNLYLATLFQGIQVLDML